MHQLSCVYIISYNQGEAPVPFGICSRGKSIFNFTGPHQSVRSRNQSQREPIHTIMSQMCRPPAIRAKALVLTNFCQTVRGLDHVEHSHFGTLFHRYLVLLIVFLVAAQSQITSCLRNMVRWFGSNLIWSSWPIRNTSRLSTVTAVVSTRRR